VWAPTAGRNLPVMFWIHGGGLHQGQSGLPLYDGKNMAETFHTVVVSINYRLGQLGFLAHPELSAENTKRISGNYGFLDQLAALMWVKENIHAFGGDPAQVTIFGESAGAWSVAAHLASPLSAGLFRAAIAESGPSQRRDRALRSPTTMMPESAEAQGVRFAHALGCPSTGAISCMRAKPASQIVSTLPATAGANGGEVYLFAIDGYAFTDIPTRMILSRHFNGVPFITGINGNESTLFTKDIEVPDAAAYTALIRKTFASSAERVLQLYPAVRYPTPKAALDAVWSDYDYVCPTRRLARAYSDVEPRTWLYQFTWVTPFGTSSGLGSYHTSELEFVFGNFNRPLTPPSPTELALSANIMTRWNSLARGLAPGSDWPAYTSTADRHLVLEAPIRVARGLNTAGCDFFDSIDLVP
jgi:para-nitrobenzyl esterase